MTDLSPDVRARRALNDRQPISRLPAELLCIIFSLVLDNGINRGAQRYTWIKLFHVCYRWYIAGVGFPALWTSLGTLASKECMQEMLRRSRRLPLEVTASLIRRAPYSLMVYQPDWKAEAANELFKELPRMKQLALVYAPKFWDPNFPNRTSQVSLPILEKMSLKVLYKANPMNPMDPLTFDVAAASPFQADIPNLRVLGLDVDCNARGVLRFPNLVSLQLEIAHAVAEYCYSITDLFDSLRGMPSLEVLSLLGAIGNLADMPAAINPVHLPKMKKVHVSDMGYGIGHVLDHLVIPAQATLSIVATFCVDDELHILDFINSFGRQFTRTLANGTSEQRLIRNLTLMATTMDNGPFRSSISFAGCSHKHDCGPTPCRRRNFSVDILYDCERDPEQLVGFQEMLQLLPSDQVKALDITGLETWYGLLSHVGKMTQEEARKASSAHPNGTLPSPRPWSYMGDIQKVFPKLTALYMDPYLPMSTDDTDAEGGTGC